MIERVIIIVLLCAVLPFSGWTLPLQSNHGELKVVPAPGPVTLDGSLDGWDLSGEMFVYHMRDRRDRYSVKVYGMWDSANLYLALHFKDPTPMVNNVDPDGAPSQGWMADSLQARFITDYGQVHMTAWYSSKFDKSVLAISYEDPLAEPKVLERATGTEMHAASGIEMAFKRDPDNAGYLQQIKLPWNHLYKNPNPSAGLTFGFTGEYYWGGTLGNKWPAVFYSDPINQENPVRVVVYQNPAVWGKAELLATGNLPKAEGDDEFDLKMQGPVPIRFEAPEGAAGFTLVIEDAKTGRRVRNLLAEAKIADYLTKKKDGKRMVEVMWDGRADGPWDNDRSLFIGELVPPGTYRARVLTHNGIGVVYAGSFYNPGTPPWSTGDGKGGWGFDHAAPCAVGAMPKGAKGAARVFLGWPGGEGGMGLLGMGDQGRKLWHWYRQGVGGEFFAATDTACYFVFGDKNVGRLNPDNGEQVRFSNGQQDIVLPGKAFGLAVRGNELAVSLDRNKIVFYDAESSAPSREVAAQGAGQICFSPAGDLVGVSNDKVLFCIKPGGKEIGQFPVPSLNVPRALTFDSNGLLYVADTADHTVKVFDKAGEGAALKAIIAEPGGHKAGKWNPNRMQMPNSVAIEERADGTTQVWVCETAYHPRRFSVWTPEGEFIKEYLGNTGYSGTGGAMSDDTPSLGIFRGGLMFAVDLTNHTYALTELAGGTPDPMPGKHSLFPCGANMEFLGFGNPNHFISKASGKALEYMTEGGASKVVSMRRGGRWLCVAALGRADSVKWPEGFPPAPNGNAVFAWNDKNEDGFQSPGEVQWWDPGKPNVLLRGWNARCGRDLTWISQGLMFEPATFTDKGAPVYDPSQVKPLPGDVAKTTPGDAAKTASGFVAEREVSGGMFRYEMVGFDKDGQELWSYPMWWGGVHGAMTAPVPVPGVIIGVIKHTGNFSLGGHNIISVRGNQGQEYLLRDDGLFLATLFTNSRMAPAEMPNTDDPKEIIGVPINDMSMGEECFSGWIGRQRDGKVRLTYGEQDVRIAEVRGLDSIQDLPPVVIDLDETLAAACRDFKPKAAGPAKVTRIEIPRGGPIPATEQEFSAVNGAVSLYAGREEVGKALLRYDDKSLHVAWQVADATPMKNGGQDAPHAFKSGDSVSLYIADAAVADRQRIHGTRVLLTLLSGQPTAMVYRPTGPASKPFTFQSPVRESAFNYVSVEPAISFDVKLTDVDYIVTATIPWSTLGLEPKPGAKFKGDLGIIWGREDTLAYVSRRVQWVDAENMIVNDVPTEAEFFPTRWGEFELK